MLLIQVAQETALGNGTRPAGCILGKVESATAAIEAAATARLQQGKTIAQVLTAAGVEASDGVEFTEICYALRNSFLVEFVPQAAEQQLENVASREPQAPSNQSSAEDALEKKLADIAIENLPEGVAPIDSRFIASLQEVGIFSVKDLYQYASDVQNAEDAEPGVVFQTVPGIGAATDPLLQTALADTIIAVQK